VHVADPSAPRHVAPPTSRPPGCCCRGAPGAEAGMVPVGKGAAGGVGGEVGPQPALLLGPRVAAPDLLAVGVERDQMPASQIGAVPALARRSGSLTEEREVRGRLVGLVVVVAGPRAGAVAVPAPAGGVAALELLGAAPLVGPCLQGKDGAGQAVQQGGGGLVPPAVAVGDVARGHHLRDRCVLPTRGLALTVSSFRAHPATRTAMTRTEAKPHRPGAHEPNSSVLGFCTRGSR
jgi:hypothetical protein